MPFGLIGARLYHVATDHDLYFGEGSDPVGALEIWHGGLGIWGAIAMGGARAPGSAPGVTGSCCAPLADALAPGLLLAQAIGRFGNYFNQELFGRPTTLPWGLEIDPAHRPAGYARVRDLPPDLPLRGAVEPRRGSACCSGLDRRFKLGYGRVFALYVMIYTAGRGWIEYAADRHHRARQRLGLRFNVWISIVLFVAGRGVLRGDRARHRPPHTREPSP